MALKAIYAGATALIVLTVGSGFLYWTAIFLGEPDQFFFPNRILFGEVSRYVPQDALAYVRLDDPAGRVGNFSESRLGRLFTNENVRKMLAEFDADAETANAYARVYDDLATLVNYPGFRALFDNGLSIALFPPDTKNFLDNPVSAIAGNLLVYASLPKDGGWTRRLIERLGRMGPDVELEQYDYRGKDLFRVKVKGKTRLLAHASNGVLVLGRHPDELWAAAEAGHSLSDSNWYGRGGHYFAEKFWQTAPGATGRAYFNIDLLRSWLERLAPALSTKRSEAFREATACLGGMTYAYLACDTGANGLDCRGQAAYPDGAFHPTKLADNCRPLTALLASFTSGETGPGSELAALMRSGELQTGIRHFGRVHAWGVMDWDLSWISAAPTGEAK